MMNTKHLDNRIPEDFTRKISAFAARVEAEQCARLKSDGMSQDIIELHGSTKVVLGKKYIKVDVGGSGKYMVVKETGEIFGIKGYGVIHKGHRYGTLETISDYDWSGYTAVSKVYAPGQRIPGRKPAPASPAPTPIVAGDRVSATIYGTLKHGTVDHLGECGGGIVFVRWDGSQSFRWSHRDSLTKIEPTPALPGSIPDNIEVYDNGGSTCDRYTVIYLNQPSHAMTFRHAAQAYNCLAMSGSPFHPQGSYQHSEAVRGEHLGKLISFSQLPADCQTAVINDLKA